MNLILIVFAWTCADCLDFDFYERNAWMTGQKKEDFWLMEK